MNIGFRELNESHFPLLLKWLEAPHVKKWWDSDIKYNFDLVSKKYTSYVNGYRKSNGVYKPISAYLIYSHSDPIGYIQIYSPYDFPRDNELAELPESLGTIDIFIGEEDYLSKGFGTHAIIEFLSLVDKGALGRNIPRYRYIFVAPEYKNEAAVKAYEKAGFTILKRMDKSFWMIAHNKIVRLFIADLINLETIFRKTFKKNDRLWVFGSRADLRKKGGDIDLYVETHAQTGEEAVEMKLEFISKLEVAIGEQKIDVVLNCLKLSSKLPIYEVASNEGVRIL